MWLQVWQLPVQWTSHEAVWKMGKVFNKCRNVIIPEYGGREGRYAKMLVELDFTKPLLRGIKVRCDDEIKWIDFRYEQLPHFCFYCGIVGHGEKNCKQKLAEAEQSIHNDGQFGEWLRVNNGRFWGKGSGSMGRVGVKGGDPGSRKSVVGGNGNAGGDKSPVLQQSSDRGMQGIEEIIDEGVRERGGRDNMLLDQIESNVGEIMGDGEKGEVLSKDEVLPSTAVNQSQKQQEVGSVQEVGQTMRVQCEKKGSEKNGGVWKRRERKMGSSQDKGRVDRSPEEGLGSAAKGKRGLSLRDEDAVDKEQEQHGKRPRVFEEEMTLYVHLVEDASQKWSQIDQ